MTYTEVIKQLKSKANAKNLAGMARFGISTKNTLGISVVYLRKLAKQIGRDHGIALQLWQSGIHEAKILASMVDEPSKLTVKQMDAWLKDFDSWDVCDMVCLNLFDKHTEAYKKAAAWTSRTKEYERRAGFALMAVLAVHHKTTPDKIFINYFPLIKKYSTDERNYVRKAVNWALRQIGKRNENCRRQAIELAEDIKLIDSKSARWIAADALRELKAHKFKNK